MSKASYSSSNMEDNKSQLHIWLVLVCKVNEISPCSKRVSKMFFNKIPRTHWQSFSSGLLCHIIHSLSPKVYLYMYFSSDFVKGLSLTWRRPELFVLRSSNRRSQRSVHSHWDRLLELPTSVCALTLASQIWTRPQALCFHHHLFV